MASNEVAPVAKKRIEIYKSMTPQTREVATAFADKLSKLSTGAAVSHYDIGARLKVVVENEAEYGSAAVEQLASYLNVPGGKTTLYSMMTFSQSFAKDFVRELSAKQMADGGYISTAHWFRVMQLKDKAAQDKMWDRIFKESLTANETELEIRALGATGKKNVRTGSGRKPSVPTSPMAGLQKTFSLAQQFANLGPVLSETVFDAIDEIAPDRVNEALLSKLEETREQLTAMNTQGADALRRVNGNIKRVAKVLKSRPAEEEEEEAKPAKVAKPSGKPAVKPAVKSSGKPAVKPALKVKAGT